MDDRRHGAAGVRGGRDRSRGMSMVEIAISISLLGLILVGVMGSLSTSFMAQRNNTDMVECQLLGQKVLEEIQAVPFGTLLSFNGSYVNDAAGRHRARIYVAPAGPNLVQIEVESASILQPQNSMRAVTLISDRK